MRSTLVLVAWISMACRFESTPQVVPGAAPIPIGVTERRSVDEPDVVPAPPAVTVVGQEPAPTAPDWYDDAFGSFSGDGVKLDVVRCTADELDLTVSALVTRVRPRPPESGIAVQLMFTRSGSDVESRARTRWWSDVRVKGTPWKGEDDVATPDIVLTPNEQELVVRFDLNTRWRTFPKLVGGRVSLPRGRIAPFLEAWNAARAARER